MPDAPNPSPFESRLADGLAELAGDYRGTPDIIPRVNAAVQRHVRRSRIRLGGVVALAAVVTVAAIVIPAQFSRANTVRNALGSVFSSSTVQFTLSATGTPDGRVGSLGVPSLHAYDEVAAYSVQVTVTNPTGGPVSDAADSDSIELSVLRGTTDLGDFMVADGAAYLHLDFDGLFGANAASETASWDQLAQKTPGLGYLSTLAAGGWVGITESAIDSYVTSRGGTPPSPVDVGSLRSSFALSFAQSWDVWTSVSQVSTVNGVTEYSLTLPVRNFLGSLLTDVTSQLEKTVPSAQREIPGLVRAIDRISSSTTVPMLMWVEGGSMTKLEVLHGSEGLVIGVSHPVVGVTAPAGATMITVADIDSWFGSLFGGCVTGSATTSGESGWTGYAPLSEGSSCSCLQVVPTESTTNPGSASLQPFECLGDNGGGYTNGGGSIKGMTDVAAQSNLQTALTGAKVFYTNNNQTYLGMLNAESSGVSSIQSIDTGLSYVSGGPSTGPHLISTDVGGGGSYVVLAAFADGTQDCWGIYDNTTSQPASVLGMPGAVGTYFFVIRESSPAACNAATITSVSASSETGFPAA